MIHCYKDYNQALIGLKRLNHIIPHNNPNLSNTLTLENHNGVPMLHFRKLKDFPWLYQGFSTRIGGVSSGIYESMNLSFNRKRTIIRRIYKSKSNAIIKSN